MMAENGRRMMFKEVITAVNAKHSSRFARSQFEKFKARYEAGANVIDLALTHPISYARYARTERVMMRDFDKAVTATPLIRGKEVTDLKDAAYLRRVAHDTAWGSYELFGVFSPFATLALVFPPAFIPALGNLLLENKIAEVAYIALLGGVMMKTFSFANEASNKAFANTCGKDFLRAARDAATSSVNQ